MTHSRLNGADPHPPLRPAAHSGTGRISANAGGARSAIRATMQRLAGAGLAPETRENVQIVLAEVINNIIEHAFAGNTAATFVIEFHLSPDQLQLTLTDRGRSFPAGRLPPPRVPDLSGPRATMPEGGFGWPLIRMLTSRLAYRRENGQNRLDLWFDLATPAAPDPAN